MTALLAEARDVTRDFRARRPARAARHAARGRRRRPRRCATARCSRSSASRAAARRRSAGCCSVSTRPTAGAVRFDGPTGARGARPSRASAAACSRSSRTPTRRSTRAGRSPAPCARRSTRIGVGTRARPRRTRVGELLERVGSRAAHAAPLPARALRRPAPARRRSPRRSRPSPTLLVADEPVSALDVLVQAQILNLLAELQRELGLAIVLITHDLAVVEHIADRVAVMYLGRHRRGRPGRPSAVAAPAHPYTRALLAIPRPTRAGGSTAPPLRGEIPSPLDPPPGCHFHPRCPLADRRLPAGRRRR